VDVTDLAAGHGVTHGAVRRVEAAVEPDLQRHAGVGDLRQGEVDGSEVERDRLLAEDRLAGPSGTADEGSMGLGGRADRDGVDVG
jgi:hypothetical protein